MSPIMTTRIPLLFLILACSVMTCKKPKTTMDMGEVYKQIRDTLDRQSGKFAVYFRDLTSYEQLVIYPDEVFHAASTMKTAVLIEVYKQAAEGKFSLDDSITLRNEFKSIVDGSMYSLDPADDSEQELYKQIGGKRKLSDLVYDMIIVSSNLATNLVIELVGPEQVTKTIHDLGAARTDVLRGVEDQKAFDKGLNNVTTAQDMAILFSKIAEGKAVSSQASEDMIRILLDQKFNEIIPARLPVGVKVAHKTGSISGVRHDCGIVFLPDGRKYVLVLLSKDMKDEEAGIKAMADVSEMIYKYVTQ
jgi:beta-lactamase class A